MSVKTAIENEKKYFENHPVYQQRAKTLGIPFLTKQLNLILVKHIKKCIPSLSKQIKLGVAEKERELSKYAQ